MSRMLAQSSGPAARHAGCPAAHLPEKIEHARMTEAQGDSLAVIAVRTVHPTDVAAPLGRRLHAATAGG